MWDWIKPVLGKVAGWISDNAGTAGAAYLGYKGQQETNAANAQQAQKQMDFQERMRATQYQTTVDDLTKAGLNPALAYGQGGAGTPGGSAATMGNPMASGISGAAAALSARQQIANVKLTEAQAEDTAAAASLKRSEVGARGFTEADKPTGNYYQAAMIARWKADALGLKLTEAQFDTLVQQVKAQLEQTQASARETSLRGDVLAPEAHYGRRIMENEKRARNWDYVKGTRDILGIITSAKAASRGK